MSGEPRYGLRRLLRSPLALFLRTLRYLKPTNGARYPLGVGGWSCPRNGEKPEAAKKCSKNAGPTPSRVHALLGALIKRQPRELKQAATAELTTLWHMTQTFAIDKSTTGLNTGQAKTRASGQTDVAKE